ncbi:MAG: hypothetical protein ACREJC_13360 [Tepidisphaeraceae bacterium]
MSEESQGSELVEAPEQTDEALYDPRIVRAEIIQRLGNALDVMSRRIERAAAGESVFGSDLDARVCLALLRSAPAILGELSSAESPNEYNPTKFPQCPICGQIGAHPAALCPWAEHYASKDARDEENEGRK